MVRTEDGAIEQRLLRIDRPVLRVPTLCIHLQSADEREAFKVNKEDHLQPILATEALKTLDGSGGAEQGDAGSEAEAEAAKRTESEPASTEAGSSDGEMTSTADMAAGAGSASAESDKSSVHTWANGQEPLLVQMIADELGVSLVPPPSPLS